MKLTKDTHKGWNKGNPDGFDHGVYTLIIHIVVSIITWFATKNYQVVIIVGWVTQLVTFIFWMWTEYKQEKAMVDAGKRIDQQSHLKFWEWSINRKQDVGIPFVFSTGFNIGLQIIKKALF